MSKLEKIKQVAIERNGSCLSAEYVNNVAKLSFICGLGHKWKTSWKNINKGAWCPECAKIKARGKNNPKYDTIENMHKIAAERSGKCLSPEYLGAHEKLIWQCYFGHEWTAKPNAIKTGSWCPKCCDGIGERLCRLIFETIFKHPFPKIRSDWLKRESGKNLELDGYCSELGVAFEYNGSQHYPGRKTIYPNSKYDNEKIKICAKNNVKLFIIEEIINMSKYKDILKQIKEQDYSININIDIPICNIYKTNQSELQFKEIKAIAELRGGKCLSNVYVDSVFKLDFECGICNYTWKASPNSIKNGCWCPRCANKCIGIDNAYELATNKNGICLSDKYINSTQKMLWQCELGHKWKASYNQIQSDGWCPICSVTVRAQKKKIGIDIYKAIAVKNGGKCLSNTINSCYDKLDFECDKGHKWKARADMLKNAGRWCPECGILRRRKDFKSDDSKRTGGA